MFFEPGLYIRVGMGPVIVEDHVDAETPWYMSVYGAKEFKKLGVSVPGITGAYDFSLKDIESGKEAGGAVSFVVVGHSTAAAFLHRESGLGSVYGLYLGLCTTALSGGFK